MIVLDASIMVGLVKSEPDVAKLYELVVREQCALGAPTLLEFRIWCNLNLPERRSDWFENLIAGGAISVVPFGRDMADIASRAFAQFGRRSGHPARLNFGDCMAYAVAAALRAPLLYKGADFATTDVMAHPASIRS